jgi:hypothetical protein
VYDELETVWKEVVVVYFKLRSKHLSEGADYSRETVSQEKKIKETFSLCLIKHNAIKTYWGVEVYLHAV